MQVTIKPIFIRAVYIALAVAFASFTSGGAVDYGKSIFVLAGVALLLSFLNTVLKPLLVLLALPLIVLTLGLGLLLINACLFLFVAFLIPGFNVAGLGAAVWGAFCVSIASMLSGGHSKPVVSSVSQKNAQYSRAGTSQKPSEKRRFDADDVIDI